MAVRWLIWRTRAASDSAAFGRVPAEVYSGPNPLGPCDDQPRRIGHRRAWCLVVFVEVVLGRALGRLFGSKVFACSFYTQDSWSKKVFGSAN